MMVMWEGGKQAAKQPGIDGCRCQEDERRGRAYYRFTTDREEGTTSLAGNTMNTKDERSECACMRDESGKSMSHQREQGDGTD